MKKFVLLALVSLLSVFAIATTAQAATVSPGGAITGTVARVGFRDSFTGVLISCDVTLRGSLNTSFTLPNGVAGSITGGSLANCTASASLGTFPRNIIAITLLRDASGTITGVLGQIRSLQFIVLGITYTSDVNILLSTSGAVTLLTSSASGGISGGTLLGPLTGTYSPRQTIIA